MPVKVGILDRHHRIFEIVGDLLRAEDDPLFEGVRRHLLAIGGIDPGGSRRLEGSQKVDLRHMQELSDDPTGEGTDQTSDNSRPQQHGDERNPTAAGGQFPERRCDAPWSRFFVRNDLFLDHGGTLADAVATSNGPDVATVWQVTDYGKKSPQESISPLSNPSSKIPLTSPYAIRTEKPSVVTA